MLKFVKTSHAIATKTSGRRDSTFVNIRRNNLSKIEAMKTLTESLSLRIKQTFSTQCQLRSDIDKWLTSQLQQNWH